MIRKRLKKPDPKAMEELAERFEEQKVGWKDRFAMIVSAYLVLLLPCLALLVAFSLLILWLFRAL